MYVQPVFPSSSHTSLQLRPMYNSCAAINGINQVIVARANELASLSARGENLIAACATLTTEETQALEEAVESPILKPDECQLIFPRI